MHSYIIIEHNYSKD